MRCVVSPFLTHRDKYRKSTAFPYQNDKNTIFLKKMEMYLRWNKWYSIYTIFSIGSLFSLIRRGQDTQSFFFFNKLWLYITFYSCVLKCMNNILQNCCPELNVKEHSKRKERHSISNRGAKKAFVWKQFNKIVGSHLFLSLLKNKSQNVSNLISSLLL